MSIIYDALKKLEPKPAPGAGASRPKEKIPGRHILAFILTAGLGLTAGTFIFFVLVPLRPPSAKPVAPPPALSAAAPQAVTPPPPQANLPLAQAPSQEARPSPSLVLNGVFFSRDEGYALINNQIVKEGDEVDGAKVKRISIDEVELDTLGSSVKLSYRAK